MSMCGHAVCNMLLILASLNVKISYLLLVGKTMLLAEISLVPSPSYTRVGGAGHETRLECWTPECAADFFECTRVNVDHRVCSVHNFVESRLLKNRVTPLGKDE